MVRKSGKSPQISGKSPLLSGKRPQISGKSPRVEVAKVHKGIMWTCKFNLKWQTLGNATLKWFDLLLFN